MKKFIYILFAALLATACVEPLQPYSGPVVNEPEDGAKVTLEFSLPPMTKGTMAHNPTISTIHVAVFNQAGVLKQFEKANLTHPTGEVLVGKDDAHNPTYSVEVNMASSKRILHFIADSPITTFDALVQAAGTSGEDVILNALTTSGGATAYWQRVELDKIDAYKYDGNSYDGTAYTGGIKLEGDSDTYQEAGQTITVNKGDYIKRNGKKVLDGTGYFQSEYVAGEIANIPFVRNFAEVTVSSSSSSNFIPKKFALVNVPKAGYVAPFDVNAGAFASAYIGKESLTHTDVAETKYPGSLVGSINTEKPTSYIDLTATGTDAIKTAYMYERTVPTTQQPATCILVAGQYDADGALRDSEGNTWFKIEIADENGGYFPIYRGLSYDIRIGKISGTKGYRSPDDAYDADPIGDISNSVTTATLEQISDGKGTTLWVEYIDYVATEAENKTIYYTMYYQPTSTSTIQYLTNGVSLTVNHPDASYKAINKDEAATISGSEYSGTGTPDDTKTWYVASVPLNTPGQNTLRSILHVEGTTNADKKMYRDVTYRVMGTQQFKNGANELKATSLPSEDAGEETTLTIYLPSDLGFSMFPLTLRIEAENGNFTTADGLPVESGPSLFGASKNAFYFLKTIEYDDYNALVSAGSVPAFTAKFKTTRDGTTSATGTNATNFRVLDKIKTGRTTTYFDYAECYVSVGGPIFQTLFDGTASNGISVKADVISVTFNIRSTGEDNPTWELTPSTNITSISATPSFSEGYYGSGNATITVNFPANTDTENGNTYTVTAKRTGFDDQVFTITQAKKTSSYYKINLDAGGNNNTYGYPWVASTTNPDSNAYWSYQSNNEGERNSIATMSVTVVGYTEFTVYIRSYAESGYYYDYDYDYCIIRKIGSDPLKTWSSSTAYNDNGTKAYTTSSSNTTIDGYTAVTFTTSDGLSNDGTEHIFYIQYGKDGSTSENEDRGYVLIPKSYTFVNE